MRERADAKTAFVLAGGGSLGAVEVGMLEALVEHGVGADVVVGSSVGAMNGAYFAARPHAAGVQELRRIWLGIHRRHAFPLTPVGGLLSLLSRRNHLSDPRGLRRLVERHLPVRELAETAIPCYLVATDILTGANYLRDVLPGVRLPPTVSKVLI